MLVGLAIGDVTVTLEGVNTMLIDQVERAGSRMRGTTALFKALLVSALIAGSGQVGLGQRRTVSGIALDVACQALPGVRIAIDGRAPVVTDWQGRFALGDTAADTITLHAALAGFRRSERVSAQGSGAPREARIFMLLGPLAEVQWVITPGTAPERPRLHGRVLDRDCRPLAGATVRLPDDADLASVTDAGGRFAFDSITSGTHDVEIAAAGFIRTVVRRFSIDARNPGELTVAMDTGTDREQATFFPE